MRRFGTAISTVSIAVAVAVALCPSTASARQPAPSPGTSCTGTDTWTSEAGDTLWSTGGNWSTNAPPSATELAVLPTATADNVELIASTQVCGLELDAETSLLVDSGQTLTAQSATVSGGPSANAYTQLAGQLVTTDLHVTSGHTSLSEADANVTVTDSATTFELDPGAHLVLADAQTNLETTGTATLGGHHVPAYLDSNSTSDGDDSARFLADAAVMLAGDVNSDGLDVITTAATTIDLDRHTWKIVGDAFSRFADGTTLKSTTVGGVLAIGNLNHLLVLGTTSIDVGAALSLQGSGTLSDGRWFAHSSAAPAHLTGAGHFAWANGDISGHVTLDSGLRTQADGSGARVVQTPNTGASTLTNAGKFTLTKGTVIVADSGDSFVNTGTVVVTGGSFGANSSAAPALNNAANAHWTVALTHGATVSKVIDGSFRNQGTLTVADGTKFAVGNKFQQTSSGIAKLTVGSTGSSRITAGALSLNGLAHVYSAPGYKPKTATATGLLDGTARSGKFAHVVSTTNRPGTKWHLSYHGARVDASVH
jgi:hypothetical protein